MAKKQPTSYRFNAEFLERLNKTAREAKKSARDIVEFAVTELLNECSVEDLKQMMAQEAVQ